MDNKDFKVDVSVVVTCYNEERHIGACLQSLESQICGDGGYEVIAVDGGSHDKTQDIIKERTGRRQNIRMVVEPKQGTAAGRNAGVRAARYDYIAFIDADCEAPADWLSTLKKNYRKAKNGQREVIAVGGRNIAPTKSINFAKAIEIALDSFPGSFGSIQGRQFKSNMLVPSLSTVNALYEKDRIREVGCFDESLESEAEDADLNFRLLSLGYKLLFTPESFVWHKMRPSPKKWFKNMFRYGKGRARLLKRHPRMRHFMFALPVLFILTMALTPLALFSKVFLMPLSYFPALIFLSLYQCLKKGRPRLMFQVAFVYLIQHFGYALGEIYGLVNPKVR